MRHVLTFARLLVVQEGAYGTPGGADAVVEVARLRQQNYLWFEAE